MIKSRPPRVLYDKTKKRYYIRSGKKKHFFPVGITKQQAVQMAVSKMRTNAKPRFKTHNLGVSSMPLAKLSNSSAKYQDTPLVVSYNNAQERVKQDVARIIQLKDEINRREREKEEAVKNTRVQEEEKKNKEISGIKQELKRELRKIMPPSLPNSPSNSPRLKIEFKENDEKQADESLSPRGSFSWIGDIMKNYLPGALPRDMQGVDIEEIPNQSGSGENAMKQQIKRDGLYSDQIANMMKDYVKQGFIGVISADEIPALIKPSLHHTRFGFVLNTDPSSKPGEHWTAVFIDTAEDKSVEYYDSYADPPPENFAVDIKKLIDAHDLPYYLKFKVNKIKEQSKSSTLCGFHAMRFLIDRFKGKPFKDCSGYSDIKKAEEIAGGMAKKFAKFGYI
jgi:hypothetical protein